MQKFKDQLLAVRDESPEILKDKIKKAITELNPTDLYHFHRWVLFTFRNSHKELIQDAFKSSLISA